MTPEEIKKIAEEYAKHTCQSTADPQQREIDEAIEYDFAKPGMGCDITKCACHTKRSKK